MSDTVEVNPNAPWSYVKFDTSIVSSHRCIVRLRLYEKFPFPLTIISFELSFQGSFVIELYHRHAPRTCYNVAALAHAGYYDNTVFHRIVRDFMIQGGDPTATGRGGESIYGGKFEDEISRNLKHTGAGIVSMANSGPNTNGSQFFITLKSTPWLDGKHTIFGRIYSGMGVAQRMGMVATDKDDKPKNPITVFQARPYRGIPPEQTQASADPNLLITAN
jgi:peptidyl-prolyl cis-trans isomerase-like 1